MDLSLTTALSSTLDKTICKLRKRELLHVYKVIWDGYISNSMKLPLSCPRGVSRLFLFQSKGKGASVLPGGLDEVYQQSTGVCFESPRLEAKRQRWRETTNHNSTGGLCPTGSRQTPYLGWAEPRRRLRGNGPGQSSPTHALCPAGTGSTLWWTQEGVRKISGGGGGYPREGWALPTFLSQNSSSEEAGETRRLLCTSDEVFGIALGEDKDPHPLCAGSFSLL